MRLINAAIGSIWKLKNGNKVKVLERNGDKLKIAILTDNGLKQNEFEIDGNLDYNVSVHSYLKPYRQELLGLLKNGMSKEEIIQFWISKLGCSRKDANTLAIEVIGKQRSLGLIKSMKVNNILIMKFIG